MLYGLKIRNRPVILFITGIQCGLWLEKDDMCFLLRNRKVLHAFWHNDKFSLIQMHISIPKLKQKLSFHNHEHLILMFMVMPDELPLQLGELHMHIIDFPRYFRAPIVIKK